MRTTRLTTALALGLTAVLAVTDARAGDVRPGAEVRTPCGDRAEMTRKLVKQYGEARQGRGSLNQEHAVEVWSSAKTGSWTVLISREDGVSCVVAHGNNWQKQGPVVVGSAL